MLDTWNKFTSATLLALTSASTQSIPWYTTEPPNCFTAFNFAGDVVLGTYIVTGIQTLPEAYAYYIAKQTKKNTQSNNFSSTKFLAVSLSSFSSRLQYTSRGYISTLKQCSLFYLFRYFSSKCEVLTNSAGLICPTCKQIKRAYKKKAERCKEQLFVNAKTNHWYMTNEQLIRKVIIVIVPIQNGYLLIVLLFIFKIASLTSFGITNSLQFWSQKRGSWGYLNTSKSHSCIRSIQIHFRTRCDNEDKWKPCTHPYTGLKNDHDKTPSGIHIHQSSLYTERAREDFINIGI